MRLLLAAFILTIGVTPALAGQTPRPGATDPRIRTVDYDPDQVILLRGYFGYQMMLEFGPEERIENVSIGDALGWQVTPNRRANLLFLKPVASDADTNMTVVTTRRRYTFELSARKPTAARSTERAYVIRFLYPPDPTPVLVEAAAPTPPPPPERRNTAYTYTGSRAALPSLVFDDGQFTYFQWPESASTPALFVLSANGTESLANFNVREGYVVVEQLAPRFLLRNGADVTTVINQGWREPAPGPDAPQPHDAKTAREALRISGGR
jgi:type IV secretion system protein VirB9